MGAPRTRSMLLAAALLAPGCLAPIHAPPLPEVPDAASLIWVVSGRDGVQSIEARAVGEDSPSLTALTNRQVFELLFYACPKEEVAAMPVLSSACLPRTMAHYRWRVGEPSWSLVGDLEPPIPWCPVDLCAERVADQVIDDQDLVLRPEDTIRAAALIRGSEPGPAVIVAIASNTGIRHVLVRLGVPPVRLIEPETVLDRSAALWAGDGRIWSAGSDGLYRGAIVGDRLELLPVQTASIALASFARSHAKLQAISTEPLELLAVSEAGGVFRWSETDVTSLRIGRVPNPLESAIGDTSDIAPISGRPGWVLIGPVQPEVDDDGKRWTSRGYVEYRDGVIGPDQLLPEAVGVASNPSRKYRPSLDAEPIHETLILTTSGALYEPHEAGPRDVGVVAEVSGSVKRLRAFRDHYVVVYKNGPLAHYFPDQAYCHGSTSPPGRIFDVLAAGDMLIELAEHARVRFLTTRRSCALE